MECACHAHPRVQGMALEDMHDDGGRAREQVALAATCASMGDEPGQSVAVVSREALGCCHLVTLDVCAVMPALKDLVREGRCRRGCGRVGASCGAARAVRRRVSLCVRQ